MSVVCRPCVFPAVRADGSPKSSRALTFAPATSICEQVGEGVAEVRLHKEVTAKLKVVVVAA